MAKVITMKIKGMECPNCSMILEGIEDKLNGVIRAEASYLKAQMIVEFNETLVNESQIKTEVQRLGYEVV